MYRPRLAGRRHVALVIVLAATALAVAPTTADAGPLTVTTTEDFCAPFTTCGSATSPFGGASVTTVINEFSPLPSGCFHDNHTSTLAYADGSTLALNIDGTLCPNGAPPNFTFSGTYTVAGGSGRFSTATGSGAASAFRQNGVIHTRLMGSISG